MAYKSLCIQYKLNFVLWGFLCLKLDGFILSLQECLREIACMRACKRVHACRSVRACKRVYVHRRGCLREHVHLHACAVARMCRSLPAVAWAWEFACANKLMVCAHDSEYGSFFSVCVTMPGHKIKKSRLSQTFFSAQNLLFQDFSTYATFVSYGISLIPMCRLVSNNGLNS